MKKSKQSPLENTFDRMAKIAMSRTNNSRYSSNFAASFGESESSSAEGKRRSEHQSVFPQLCLEIQGSKDSGLPYLCLRARPSQATKMVRVLMCQIQSDHLLALSSLRTIPLAIEVDPCLEYLLEMKNPQDNGEVKPVGKRVKALFKKA